VTLRKRLEKLEGTIQERPVKMADLSKFSDEELDVLEKVYDFTLAREVANPTGRRPIQADLSGLSADDMVIYQKIAERAECR